MHYLVYLSLSRQRRLERNIILHMCKIIHGYNSNNLNVQFVTRPRFGNIAVIPSISRVSTAANQSLYDSYRHPNFIQNFTNFMVNIVYFDIILNELKKTYYLIIKTDYIAKLSR